MCAHIMMPCHQQPRYVASHSTINPTVDHSAVYFSFSPFGGRIPYPEPIVHQPPPTNARHIAHLANRSAFVNVPISPRGSDLSFYTNSPTSLSSNSLKFYSPAGSINQSSQSSLIMPNLFTFFKKGSQQSSGGPYNKKDPSWNKNASCKSLASLTKDTLDFPHPLIRKCNTSVSLSSSAVPVHTVLLRDRSTENVSTKVPPLSRPTTLFEYYSSKRGSSVSRKSSKPVPVWTKPGDSVAQLLEEQPVKACCSRCNSSTSLNHCRKDSMTPATDTLFCKMCLGDFSIKDMYQLQQCQCRFCTYCMKMYLMLKIQDGESRIECPDSNCDCNGEFTIEDVENLQSDKYIQLFLKYRAEAEIDLDSSRVWCPAPGCETVIQLASSVVPGREYPASCPTCSLQFCATCSNRWVGTHSCSTYTKKLKDFIKRCPRCEILIERDAGCAQMQCKKCKHVFCWYCLTSLEDDFLLRHYDKGSCKNKLGHSRASVLWHRAQVITIFTTVGLIMIAGFPILLFLGPCLLCRRCCMNCISADRREYYYNV